MNRAKIADLNLFSNFHSLYFSVKLFMITSHIQRIITQFRRGAKLEAFTVFEDSECNIVKISGIWRWIRIQVADRSISNIEHLIMFIGFFFLNS